MNNFSEIFDISELDKQNKLVTRTFNKCHEKIVNCLVHITELNRNIKILSKNKKDLDIVESIKRIKNEKQKLFTISNNLHSTLESSKLNWDNKKKEIKNIISSELLAYSKEIIKQINDEIKNYTNCDQMLKVQSAVQVSNVPFQEEITDSDNEDELNLSKFFKKAEEDSDSD